ncbi:phenylalanine-tRNA ligase [Trichosporon asahii var. asahii CBS 8904]|uniref:phenylalanine--tRNA ligase n=1 Tax=Trichosporon asahii var. asahii (strain CBS 8904) TaxID=1220162 RepID=K1VVI2_TRIAC|nr:phenylalanine-tRNA ligase [Trichosporon asahii var. asahii CBS 8904]
MSLPTVEEVQTAILKALDASPDGKINDTRTLVVNGKELGENGQTLVKAALDSLQTKDEQITETVYGLTEEGAQIAKEGSHEYRVWEALPPKGGAAVSIPDLKKALGDDVVKIGQGRRDGGAAQEPDVAGREGPEGVPEAQACCSQAGKGKEFALEVKTYETDLTVDMLQSGAWKDASFKQYNFAAMGEQPNGGALHPLLKVREEFRQIFFDLGFTEMPTDHFVESAFWNFDAMFVPQQHPARELQDTFYVADPVKADIPDEPYYERVAKTHEVGGYGSIGYRAPFSRLESEKLLLRTHTTSVSTAMLYKIANQPGGFKPAKLFSIDRVFRNEATDATHLAEFHQVEGVVADYDITLGHLIGFMKEFFAKTGNHKLRFKPAFNPYTEPSMEVFSWHEGLGKWIEIANVSAAARPDTGARAADDQSGVFRPEMLEPMGLPKGVRVLGWGMSLERPTMIKYKIQDIRTLVGHKTDLAGVKSAAAVRLDKGDD